MDNGGRLIPYEYSGNGREELNYNSSDSEASSSSEEDAYEYTQRKEKFFRHLFNSPLKKIRFSVDGQTGNSFTWSINKSNKLMLNNVVGFNVISARITNTDSPQAAYIDIEITEIPSISCINTSNSQNIVARIPPSSSVVNTYTYHSQTTDLTDNHFFPIELFKLSINLINVTSQSTNLNMICEATVLGDLPEDF